MKTEAWDQLLESNRSRAMNGAARKFRILNSVS
jgi:hypothetical protein